MASSIPYLSSNKNVEKLFSAIASAKVPDRFTQKYLEDTVGLKGTNDRQLIAMLRNLGFLDQTGAPTANYRLLKSPDTAKQAVAEGIKKAYAPLFAANETANALPPEKLRGLVAQVAGSDDGMTARISQTLQALMRCADFTGLGVAKPNGSNGAGEADVSEEHLDEEVPDRSAAAQRGGANRGTSGMRGLKPEFHYNIQVHLPNNATEEVYLNIFNALRKSFQ